MNKTISLTVDTDDYNALIRVSDMLHGMAQDVKNNKSCTSCKDKEEIVIPVKIKTSVEDKEVEIDIKREDYSVDTSAADAFKEDDKPAIPDGMGTPGAIPGTVELDSQGLPWDVRIHSKNKSKLAKDQSWKKKRGIDPALVVQVEAELRAAMATPAASVETPASPTTETPATPAPAQTETTTPKPPTTTAVLTFPDLMGKITTAMGAGTLTNEMIMSVINPKGLASLPLVAARPDLIPEINAELFPNG